MSLSAKDFKDKYVLWGRLHDPSQNQTLFDKYSKGCFNIILEDTITDDASAIAVADEIVRRDTEKAKIGEQLAATLCFNKRTIKDYPKQMKGQERSK